MKVSIIVPVYNVEKYIRKCVDSLINQTLFDIEIILIDDGSTDNSGVICDEYANKDKRIKVIHKSNGGVSSARNVGLDSASGEFIGFVDPDDWCEAEMYEKMYEMAKNHDCNFVICGYCIDYENEIINRKDLPEVEGVVEGYEALYQCLRGQGHGCFTAVWNKLIKKEIIGKIRFNNEFKISEDEVFLSELSKGFDKAFIIKSAYYHWYQSNNSAIRSYDNYLEKWRGSLTAKLLIPKTIDDKKCKNLAKANIYATLMSVVWTLYGQARHQDSKQFYSKIKKYRYDFLFNHEFSWKKKTRYEIILLLIKIHARESYVLRLGQLTSVEIKNRALVKNKI